MGSPVEGRQWPQIDREYPGHVLTVLQPWRLESEDDNQMMMLLAETYLARDGRPVMARHFGRTWAERLNRDHFHPSRYDDVLSVRAELYEKCLLYHMIDPLELWGLTLAMLRISRGDVRQAAIGGTNIGRDSDTIAGRSAMLSGALGGCAGIPAEWVALFSTASLARIDRNAERLSELVGERRLAQLQVRTRMAD